MAIDIARIAYQKHFDMMHGMNKENNRGLSTWEQLDKDECDAWRAAAVAVIQYIDKQRGLIGSGLIG